MVLFVLHCSVVDALDWVVSLTSSLENTFMVIHVAVYSVTIKSFVYLPKPTEIHSLEIF